MPARPALREAAPIGALLPAPPPPPSPSPQEVIAERLQTKPQVLNSSYSIAEGAETAPADIMMASTDPELESFAMLHTLTTEEEQYL